MAEPKQTPKFKLPVKEESNRRTYLLMTLVGIIILIASAAGTGYFLKAMYPRQNTAPQVASTQTDTSETTKKIAELKLDPKKNYGNKYADGVLPIGDGKYVADSAKKGHVFACQQYIQSFTGDNAGARGPWFVNNNTQYDINKKSNVQGSVSWKGTFDNAVLDNKRTITTNGLPLAHTTGAFPITSNDLTYIYDHNPYTISEQTITYSLTAQPIYGAPQCINGEVGVMTTGVPLFNAFDSGGRDAGAWEVHDDCGGHPQAGGEYHYHTLSSCIKDTSVKSIIGFALDGFPITGPKVGPNNILTTNDLDECHGIVSEITVDDKPANMYHYVMTDDFPYSVSCFRAKPIQPPIAKQVVKPATPPADQQQTQTPTTPQTPTP
jgi:hypothetical protein